jgi:hypothetical protein
MASASYISGRKKYARPQAMLWSETPGVLSGGLYVPTGYEINSDKTAITSTDDFLILSDHNRGEISVNTERIEQRKRMANGTMRSYHIADKLQISTNWNMLPSRSHSVYPAFNQSTGKSPYDDGSSGETIEATEYTSDGGAGGVEMLDWYENHTGPFWVFLAYDKYTNFGNDNSARSHLAEYNQIIQMYITGFDYSIAKRGQSFVTGYDIDGKPIRSGGHDMWNVSVSLEEV